MQPPPRMLASVLIALSVLVAPEAGGAQSPVATERSSVGEAERRSAGGAELLPVGGDELRRLISASDARALVVNVWATWCVPCREEFPALLRLRENYHQHGVELLLVSGDFPTERAAAVEFLAEAGVSFPTYLKTGKDMEFIDALHADWSGALPATFIYDGGGAMVDWWQGAATYEKFAAAVDAALAESSAVPAVDDHENHEDHEEKP